MNPRWAPKPRLLLAWMGLDRLGRRGVAELVVVLVMGVLLNVFFACIYWKLSWRELPREGQSRKWQRGQVLHIDEDGDGRVDEEIVDDPKTKRRVVRRDTNHDGWFDLKYQQGRYGIAMKLIPIHERAPWH